MIRGLLCGSCNISLARVENCLFKPKPDTMNIVERRDKVIRQVPYPDELFAREREEAEKFFNQHKNTILLYLQEERWLPQ